MQDDTAPEPVDPPAPTPAQIAQRTAEIRATWDERTRASRRCGVRPVRTIDDSQVIAGHGYLTEPNDPEFS